MRHVNGPRQRWTQIAAITPLLLSAIVAGTHLASAASAGCRVSYAVSSQWPGGFGADVTVTNLGDSVNGWRLTWSFTAGQTVTQLWNGSCTQSGAQMSVASAAWNGSISTGGSAGFGFNGAWNGSNPVPTSFALNGTVCTGGVIGSSAPAMSGPASPSTGLMSPPPAASLPCDIYAAGGAACVTAHSTVRVLYRSYSGNLYQVRRSSDNTTRNIAVLTAGGVANAAGQDSFCAGTSCVITIVYDQSGHGNNLAYQGFGGAGGADTPASATSESLTVGGSKAYSLYIRPGNSYWRNGSSSGVPTGSAPEGMYMVTSGTHVNSGCCFDYGNSETSRRADGAGAMDAIYFGTSCWFAIKGGNAQSGSLATLWDGALPAGYSPRKKQAPSSGAAAATAASTTPT